MKKIWTVTIIGLLCLSTFSIFAPNVKAEVISQTDDPTGDWFIGITGQPVQGHDFLDIIHSEVSLISATEVEIKTRVAANIPSSPSEAGCWPGFRWFFDVDRNPNTGRTLPSLFNDIGVDYFAELSWSAGGYFVADVRRYADWTVVADIVDYSTVGDTIEARFSLSSIENPSSFDWVADSTDGIEVNDHAPNTGHITLTTVTPVFPWRDDFNYNTLNEMKSAGWTFFNEPFISVGGGALTFDNDGSIGSHIYWTHFPAGVCDYRSEFSVMWIGRSYGSISLTVLTERHSYGWTGDGYYPNFVYGRDTYDERIGGYNPTMNTWMSFVFEKNGNTINLYWNGNLIRTVTETDPTSGLKGVDISCGWISTNKIDYISATSPTAPDFEISVSPDYQTVTRGQSAVSLITLRALNGFSSPISLTLEGLPPETTFEFSPSSLVPDGTSTLTLTTSLSTPCGTYALNIVGASDQRSKSVTTLLLVEAVLFAPYSGGLSGGGKNVIGRTSSARYYDTYDNYQGTGTTEIHVRAAGFAFVSAASANAYFRLSENLQPSSSGTYRIATSFTIDGFMQTWEFKFAPVGHLFGQAVLRSSIIIYDRTQSEEVKKTEFDIFNERMGTFPNPLPAWGRRIVAYYNNEAHYMETFVNLEAGHEYSIGFMIKMEGSVSASFATLGIIDGNVDTKLLQIMVSPTLIT